MSRVVSATAETLKLDKESKQDLRLAALLHDVGHYPYSHLMERLDDVVLTEDRLSSPSRRPQTVRLKAGVPYPDHEEVGRLIVTKQADLLTAISSPKRAQRIADLFTRSEAANPQLSKLIHSSLDMDRLDYLLRDARAAGVPYGEIDLHYLMNNLRVSPSGMIGIDHKALSAAEQFLLARYFMHKTVYYHKTTFALEEACRQLLRRCRDKRAYHIPRTGREIEGVVRDSSKLLEFTDHLVDSVAHKALSDSDQVIRSLAEAIVYRKPPKLLREESALVDMNNEENKRHNAASAFMKSCAEKLERLATDFKMPLGKFLLAETRPIRLEERGPLIPAAQAAQQPAEEEDELIKVFVPGEQEPKSLVDVSDSIVRLCANHAARVTRLYVVEHDKTIVARMRKQVERW